MIKLYTHQKIALSYLRSNDSFALFMDPRHRKDAADTVSPARSVSIGIN